MKQGYRPITLAIETQDNKAIITLFEVDSRNEQDLIDYLKTLKNYWPELKTAIPRMQAFFEQQRSTTSELAITYAKRD